MADSSSRSSASSKKTQASQHAEQQGKKSTQQRSGKSLVLLSKKFMELMDANDGQMDLRTAHIDLNVKQKRRIYDIVNVMEGVGLIKKISKYIVEWQGSEQEDEEKFRRHCRRVKQELFQLDQEHRRINALKDKFGQNMRLFSLAAPVQTRAYVTKDDILAIPELKDQLKIAIKAPRGASLAVPVPNADEPAPYDIFLESKDGPIDALLIRDTPQSKLQSVNASTLTHQQKRGQRQQQSQPARQQAAQPARPTNDTQPSSSSKGATELTPIPNEPLLSTSAKPQQAEQHLQPSASVASTTTAATMQKTAGAVAAAVDHPPTSARAAPMLDIHPQSAPSSQDTANASGNPAGVDEPLLAKRSKTQS